MQMTPNVISQNPYKDLHTGVKKMIWNTKRFRLSRRFTTDSGQRTTFPVLPLGNTTQEHLEKQQKYREIHRW